MRKFALHSPLRSWKKGDYPVSPFASVAVGITSQAEDSAILLSQKLMTESEIDHAIDGLIKELEELRKEAKKELTTLQAKMLSK